MKLNKNVDVSNDQIYSVVGRKDFKLTVGGDFVEVPDTLSLAELNAINTLIYPDATAFNAMTDSQKINFLYFMSTSLFTANSFYLIFMASL